MAGRDRDRDDTGIPVSDRQAKQATRGSVSSPVSIIIPIIPISVLLQRTHCLLQIAEEL